MTRARKSRRRGSGLLAALPVCLTLGGLLPLGAAFWWPFELLSHFRLQYLVVALLALGIALVARRITLAIALLVVMVANALPLLPYTPLSSHAARANADSANHPGNTLAPIALTVLNINVNASNPQHDRIIAALQESGADVVMLVELSHELAAKLHQLDATFPYQALFPQAGNFGIGLLSSVELTDMTPFQLGQTTAIEAGISLNGERIGLMAVHTWPPMNSAMAAERNLQLDQLAARTKQVDGAVVICGDLNLTPYSPWFARLLAESGTTDTRAGHWPGISWPVEMPLLGIPIDHCLVSDDLYSTGIKRLNSIGSDHYPVRVDLGWHSQQ